MKPRQWLLLKHKDGRTAVIVKILPNGDLEPMDRDTQVRRPPRRGGGERSRPLTRGPSRKISGSTPQKTAVISQRGMSAALAMGSGLPRFLEGQKIAPYVDVELAKKLANPLVFQWSPSMSNTPPAVVYGYEVTILIDVCKTIIAADSDGKLLSRQSNIVKQAHIILNASAKAGIQGLVYALAGYDVTRAEVIQAVRDAPPEGGQVVEAEAPDRGAGLHSARDVLAGRFPEPGTCAYCGHTTPPAT